MGRQASAIGYLGSPPLAPSSLILLELHMAGTQSLSTCLAQASYWALICALKSPRKSLCLLQVRARNYRVLILVSKRCSLLSFVQSQCSEEGGRQLAALP